MYSVFIYTHLLKCLAIGRSVGRRDRASIARQVVVDRKLPNKTLPLIGKAMARECWPCVPVPSRASLYKPLVPYRHNIEEF